MGWDVMDDGDWFTRYLQDAIHPIQPLTQILSYPSMPFQFSCAGRVKWSSYRRAAYLISRCPA
jgi:hypothetical protein